jgi:hypothetical protein
MGKAITAIVVITIKEGAAVFHSDEGRLQSRWTTTHTKNKPTEKKKLQSQQYTKKDGFTRSLFFLFEVVSVFEFGGGGGRVGKGEKVFLAAEVG